MSMRAGQSIILLAPVSVVVGNAKNLTPQKTKHIAVTCIPKHTPTCLHNLEHPWARENTMPTITYLWLLLLVALTWSHSPFAGTQTTEDKPDFADQLFEGLDLNKDGAISGSEAKQYIRSTLKEEFGTEQELAEATGLFVSNLDKHEVHPATIGGAKPDPQHPSISEEELEAHIHNLFKVCPVVVGEQGILVCWCCKCMRVMPMGAHGSMAPHTHACHLCFTELHCV